jgi:uncharacterized membrane protein
MKKLASHFLRGVFILVPVAVTVYIVAAVFRTLDRLLPLDTLLPVRVPGLGVALALVVITVVGFLGSNVLGRSLFRLTEAIFTRLPLIKLLYTSIRDLVGAFVGDKRRFDRPVAVRVSADAAVRVFGFVTRDDLAALELQGNVAVYVPQSYNFAGTLLIVPNDRVEALQTGAGELMSFIVSGGVSGYGAK